MTATRRRGQGPHPAAGWGARGGTKPGQAPGQAPEGGPRRQRPGRAREGPRGGGGAGTSPRRPPQGADRTPRRAARAADRGPRRKPGRRKEGRTGASRAGPGRIPPEARAQTPEGRARASGAEAGAPAEARTGPEGGPQCRPAHTRLSSKKRPPGREDRAETRKALR